MEAISYRSSVNSGIDTGAAGLGLQQGFHYIAVAMQRGSNECLGRWVPGVLVNM